MKKIFLLFTVIVFFGCNSDDNSNENLLINNQDLIGKWYLKGGITNGGDFENYNHDCSTNRDFQEFFPNGELTFNGYNADCELNEVETSLWVLNGSTLTISNTNNDPINYNYSFVIESLTNEELIIKEQVNTPNGEEVNQIYLTRN